MRCGSQVTVVEVNTNATLLHKLSLQEQQQIQKNQALFTSHPHMTLIENQAMW